MRMGRNLGVTSSRGDQTPPPLAMALPGHDGKEGSLSSQAALNMLTKCLALEYGSSGILCVSVDPGHVTPPLEPGMVSDGRCMAILAQQGPTGILSLEHPFPRPPLPMNIPSQGHPSTKKSFPRNIPSHRHGHHFIGHFFPWTSLSHEHPFLRHP